MATLVECLDQSDFLKAVEGNFSINPIGYLTINPSQALKDLLPNFYVVDYLGLSIPSRSEYTNYNLGLRISHVADGIGLIGTIEMLNQSDLFQSCRHEHFSDEQKLKIVEKMKSRLTPPFRTREPLNHLEAEKYAFIFDILGYHMSIGELVKFTTPEDYYDPIPNGGILMPEDLPRFP